MKYTEEQLAGMSDFERNCYIFKKLGGRGDFHEGERGGLVFSNGLIINYCNNPNDIMPLAFENRVCVISSPKTHGDKWSAIWNAAGGKWSLDDVSFHDKNPLRAIVCCLILVLQDK